MAFHNGLTDRMDELRFANPRSPPDDTPFSGYTSPPRGQPSYMSTFRQPSNDARASLQRRFTTDASKLSALASVGQQPPQLPDSIDLSSATHNLHKAQLFERKRQQMEFVRAEKKRIEESMKMLDLQEERDQQEMEQMAKELGRVNLAMGPVSEPTTPPEYRDHGFPTPLSRPDRFSASNLASPPGLRYGQSASQITSPPSERANTSSAHAIPNKPSAKSMPGSRRNSEEDEYFPEHLPAYRQATSRMNRYSMPATGLASQLQGNVAGYASTVGLGHINTTSFLFGDDDHKPTSSSVQSGLTSPDIKSYLQLTDPDDKFPTLIRRDDNSGILSANSAALDLANSRSPGPETWASYTRHRPSHQSLPQNALNMFRLEQQLSSPPSERQSSDVSATQSPGSGRRLNRHSIEVGFAGYGDSSKLDEAATAAGPLAHSRPGSLQSSYSTNDLPTMKTTNGFGSTITPPRTHAEQHLHNHNASLGRIPPNAVSNRQSRDLSIGYSQPETKREEQSQTVQPMHSALQASAAPFGPQLTSTASPGSVAGSITPTPMAPYSSPFYGYGLQSYAYGQMGSALQMNNQMQAYQPQGPYGYQTYGNYGRFQDSQARVMHQRRVHGGEGENQLARFTNVPLENYVGELYGLCKDQHGCRYLQRKLEERRPEIVQMIFVETHQHVVELMTDPFGNYLCQKLLEFSNDEQRTALINNAASQMVKIALNQHGTRALQKMIEFISTQEQIQTIIHALQDRVVELVQDLNGNHVIQKCLNRLSIEDAQFIYDAVGGNCVVVGTHRHGCCVLQRCIDHASGHQRAHLIGQITANAFALVQDPYGNYVVQYILDLSEPAFTEPLCLSFRGNIPALSKQKFSSNVIEKCLRTADLNVKRLMIEEMLNANELERMLRDSFANYVVQTAMDYADAETKTRIVEAVRPILPAIRQTPHGRRIAGKIMGSDVQGRLSGVSSGHITPNDVSSPGQLPVSRQMTLGPGQNQFSFQPQNTFQTPNNVNHYMGMSDTSTAIYNPSTQTTNRVSGQQPFTSYTGGPLNQGYNYF